MADFNDFWHATWYEETWRKWLLFCPTHLITVATLPCEMQKSYFGRLQQWIHMVEHASAQKDWHPSFQRISNRIIESQNHHDTNHKGSCLEKHRNEASSGPHVRMRTRSKAIHCACLTATTALLRPCGKIHVVRDKKHVLHSCAN